MAHSFDSGLAKPQRTLTREAVVAALAELRKLSPGTKYLAAIVELPAPVVIGSEESEGILKEALAGQSPAIAIALGRRDFDRTTTDSTDWHGPLQVYVYCCSTHARGVVAGRTASDVVALADNTADPGVEVIAEHTFERLSGLVLDAERGAHLQPVREEPAFVGADWTIFEQLYQVELHTVVNPDRAVTEVVTEVHTTHTESVAGEPSELEARTELEEP